MRRRLLVRKRSRAARKAERYIADYQFPAHIEKRIRRRSPELDDAGWALVEQGLREWFVCCAWRGRTVLGMPSQLVDEAWHEFILDSLAYMSFCQAAFGEYLHHTPDEAMAMPMGDALGETVRAWDRSEMGAERNRCSGILTGASALSSRWASAGRQSSLPAPDPPTRWPRVGPAPALWGRSPAVETKAVAVKALAMGAAAMEGATAVAVAMEEEAAAVVVDAAEAAARPGALDSGSRCGSRRPRRGAGCRGRGCRRRP